MSVNIRDYVSDDHVESIGEISRSQSAIIQALSIDNSNLEKQLLHKDNIIKGIIEILNNKRTIMTTKLLNGEYCDYEELLYQIDEEIRKILDKEYKIDE